MPPTGVIPTAIMYRLAFHPRVMKGVARVFYPLFTQRLDAAEVLFLNDGYEENPPMGLALAEADQPYRYPIQLYHRVAAQADLEDKRVLEVSSGHGGGASYLTRTLRPASYVGLDLNTRAVAFCAEHHSEPGLSFVQGDAENLPFADESFDAVVNVEASHCYPRFPRFLDEVARVLRPGGRFLYADLRPRLRVAEWEAALAAAPLRMLTCRVIDDEVLRALASNSAVADQRLRGQLPALLHGVAREAFHVEGSRFYRDLQRGELTWRMYDFAKD
jgi:ubiquinone/menaquinone biosynthesis C-methylase UbiE